MYQIIEAKTRRQIAWGLSLAEARRFVRDRKGCYFIPVRC